MLFKLLSFTQSLVAIYNSMVARPIYRIEIESRILAHHYTVTMVYDTVLGVRVPPSNILSNALFIVYIRKIVARICSNVADCRQANVWTTVYPADRIIQPIKPRNKVPMCQWSCFYAAYWWASSTLRSFIRSFVWTLVSEFLDKIPSCMIANSYFTSYVYVRAHVDSIF